ncbi:hypothetical protein D3C85_1598590 [compost metagenome]
MVKFGIGFNGSAKIQSIEFRHHDVTHYDVNFSVFEYFQTKDAVISYVYLIILA